jgi:copper resistance protein C
VRASRGLGFAILGVTLGLLGAATASVAASAHDVLIAADPASGDTVATLDAVTLTFNADPLGGDGADVIQVTGPDGRHYETACPTLTGPEVSAPVALGPAGSYKVVWRIVSSDGHPVSGDYTFTYAPESTASQPATGSSKALCGTTGPDTAATSTETGSGTAGPWIGIGVGAGVAVLIGIGVWLLIRNPRSS